MRCKHGHAFITRNTRIAPSGQRVCRMCDRIRKRLERAKTRQSPLGNALQKALESFRVEGGGLPGPAGREFGAAKRGNGGFNRC